MIVPGALSTIKIDDVPKSSVHPEEVYSLGKASCGIVLVAGVVGVVLEVVTIVLRFINVGIINMKIKYFLLGVSAVALSTHVCMYNHGHVNRHGNNYSDNLKMGCVSGC